MKGVPDGRAAQSIRSRLLNRSRETGEDYNLLLIRFGVERLLYRLCRSEYGDDFVLKGAMLFAAWTGNVHRPTRDLDLLGFGESSPERLVVLFRGLCDLQVEDDGLRFDPATVSCETIRDEQAYGGVRVKVRASLGNARINLQVDVGFGDVVMPEPKLMPFPSLLGLPAPVVRAYSPESVVAEKLEAMVSLGIGNSRMKDFYDVWFLLREIELDERVLSRAIQATFERRRTALPGASPVAFSDELMADPMKNSQWKGFLARADVTDGPEFPEVIALIRDRLTRFLG